MYKKFLEGELVALCVPEEKAIGEDLWHQWFNDVDRHAATQHAIFPNHESTQREILQSLAGDKSRVTLLITGTDGLKASGVISLQNIDFRVRSAEIAIIMSSSSRTELPRLSALEAMALLTEHGFVSLGLDRIYAGQAYPLLASWNKALELIGYKTEGLSRGAFVRGHSVQDIVSITCHYDVATQIIHRRGSLWGDTSKIKSAMKRQPKAGFADSLDSVLREMSDEHYSFLER